jgi:2-dehydropantoate 2-reductase
MKFVIYGAGAIGGVIGGRLYEAGHDVTLLARGDHLAALQADGLRLMSPDGTVVLPVPAAERPDEVDLAPGDVVLLCMKGQDTPAALRALAATAPEGIAVVCAQNGVENERMALRIFPDVYAMTVMLPATHLDPGVVAVHSAPVSGILDLGRYPEGVDDTAVAIAAALAEATFVSEPRADALRWKYRKLTLNLVNVAMALCKDSPDMAGLIRLLRAEGEAVLAAAGIELVSIDEDRERRGDLIAQRPVEGVPRVAGSSWQSLARGTGSIETDYLTGEIVLLGRLHGVPTPANALMQRLAGRAAATREPPNQHDPGQLLAELGQLGQPSED